MTARTAAPDDLGLLSVPEVAARLALHRGSVYDLIRAGSLRPVTLKGKYRIDKRELRRYLDRLAAERDGLRAVRRAV